MPRKRQAAAEEDASTEQRTTRRSLRTRAPPPPPVEEVEEDEEEVSTPTKRGGKGRGRGKKVATPSKRGRGRGSASTSPRGRKGKKKVGEDEEDSELEASDSEDPSVTPTKGRRSARSATTPEEGTSPRRRSSRGAAAAASEAIGKQAEKDDDTMDDEESEDATRGTKRKADEEPVQEDEGSSEKRQKVEESTKDKPTEETEKSDADAAEAKTETPMESESAKEDKAESKEDVKPAQEEEPVKEAATTKVDKVANESATSGPTEAEAKQDEPMDADEAGSGATKEHDDYVLVEKEEVPAHDSQQVQDSLPKPAPPAATEGVAKPDTLAALEQSPKAAPPTALEKSPKATQSAEPKQSPKDAPPAAPEKSPKAAPPAAPEQSPKAAPPSTPDKTPQVKAAIETTDKPAAQDSTENAAPSADTSENEKPGQEIEKADVSADPPIANSSNGGDVTTSNAAPTAPSLVPPQIVVTPAEAGDQLESVQKAVVTTKVDIEITEADDSDYVHVTKDEVPAHDSADVQQSLPPVVPPEPKETKPVSSQNEINKASTDAVDGTKTTASVTNSNDGNVTNTITNAENDISKPAVNPLFSRKVIMNPHIDHSTVKPERCFSIASYNILAECHAQRGVREWGQYTWSTEEKLSNEYRHPLFWQELEYLDADIYCMQEVPPAYFKNVLVPAFKAKGFEGHFIKRAHDDYEEGEATFYNTKRFTAVNCQGYVLHDLAKKGMEAVGLDEEKKALAMQALHNPAVFMLCKLRCNQTGRVINVANIHVSWEFMKRPDIQCTQIASAIKELVEQAGGATEPHIICGDFNSTPDSPGYQLARDGYLSEANITLLKDMNNIEAKDGQKTSLINLWWKGFQHTSNTLKSAYHTVQGHESISSCFPHNSDCLAVDCVWFSTGALQVTKVLSLPDDKLITKGIPNEIFPSDHLSVKACLAFA